MLQRHYPFPSLRSAACGRRSAVVCAASVAGPCVRPSQHHEAASAAQQQHEHHVQRRQVVLLGVLALGTPSALGTPHAEADEERKLPKAYRSVVENIIKSLRDALDAEVDGSNEYEIRRKADPAKSSVREFVGKWKDDIRVTWHPSHQEIEGAITELGQFYQQAGPRARLSSNVQQSVRKHLDAAEQALAVQLESNGEKSFLGLFPGV